MKRKPCGASFSQKKFTIEQEIFFFQVDLDFVDFGDCQRKKLSEVFDVKKTYSPALYINQLHTYVYT